MPPVFRPLTVCLPLLLPAHLPAPSLHWHSMRALMTRFRFGTFYLSNQPSHSFLSRAAPLTKFTLVLALGEYASVLRQSPFPSLSSEDNSPRCVQEQNIHSVRGSDHLCAPPHLEGYVELGLHGLMSSRGLPPTKRRL